MRSLRIVSIVLCIVFAGSYLVRGTIWVIKTYNKGQMFTSKAWLQSQILEQIRALPHEILIFTNEPAAVYIPTGRPVSRIPYKFHYMPGIINSNYLSELVRMRDQLKRRNGVLVYINTFPARWSLPTEKELKDQLPLHLLVRVAEGSIYKIE